METKPHHHSQKLAKTFSEPVLPSALTLFIEPTPYIVRLDEEIQRQWPAEVSSFYIAKSVSQEWTGADDRNVQCILPAGRMRAISFLWREIWKNRPGVVFVAGWAHPVVIATILIARLLGAKVVSSSDTWTSSSGGLHRVAKRLLLRLVHCFSPGGRRQALYLQNLGVPEKSIFPANMTVDTAEMRAYLESGGLADRRTIREAMGLGPKDPLFLFVGRLEPVKGPDLVLEAFTTLQCKGKASLAVVGDGSMRPIVEQAVARDSRIVYPGRLEGRQLWAQFAAADALVAPSRSEPWGLVVNEALTAGLAIVLSNVFGCIDDLIRPEENALVVPAEDSAALSTALRRLVENPDLLKRLGGNAERSVDGWTTETWAAKILTAWRHALNHKAGSRLRF